MNNLDPDVAERPDDLIVYGGSGKAARNWESYDAIVSQLRRLDHDDPLVDRVRGGRQEVQILHRRVHEIRRGDVLQVVVDRAVAPSRMEMRRTRLFLISAAVLAKR